KGEAQQDNAYKPEGIRLASPNIEFHCPRSTQAGCRLEMCLSDVGTTCLPGVLKARASNGTPPYTFSAIDPDGNPLPTSPDGDSTDAVTFPINKLGTHTATVTDAAGCRVMASLQPGLRMLVISVSPSRCLPAEFKATVSNGL